MSQTWVFVGKPGQYIAGVPARDLTDAEADQFNVKGSPLYEPVSNATPASEPVEDEE